jgi:hypothetical protein
MCAYSAVLITYWLVLLPVVTRQDASLGFLFRHDIFTPLKFRSV